MDDALVAQLTKAMVEVLALLLRVPEMVRYWVVGSVPPNVRVRPPLALAIRLLIETDPDSVMVELLVIWRRASSVEEGAVSLIVPVDQFAPVVQAPPPDVAVQV